MAEGGDVGVLELFQGFWRIIQAGWSEGGLAFVAVLALFAFLSDRFVSGKRFLAAIKEWETRYDVDLKKAEARRVAETAEWERRYSEERARADSLLRMLIDQMRHVEQAQGVAATATGLAERVAATVTPILPGPPGSPGSPGSERQ